jgi:regulator of nucleoside diphosphate kinase
MRIALTIKTIHGDQMKDRIYITQTDMERLQRILEGRVPANQEERNNIARLEDELDRAEVLTSNVPPANVVTMHSEVRLKDLDTNQIKDYKLVFPGERVTGAECISVLAPIGTALLGYRTGSIISWPVPKGIRRLQVLKIVQPRALANA